MHVSQALQRVWKAVSSSFLEWLKAEAALYSVQAVHRYGQASGAHSWHSLRPSAFCHSWLSCKDLRHMLQALYWYFSIWWQAWQTSESAGKYPSERCCVHLAHREVEVLGGAWAHIVHTRKEPRPMQSVWRSATSCRFTS